MAVTEVTGHRYLGRIVLSMIASLFILSLLQQLIWYKHESSTIKTYHGNMLVANQTPPKRGQADCSMTTRLLMCIGSNKPEHEFGSFEPPSQLETTCRQLLIQQATKSLLVFVPIGPNMLAQRTVVRETWGAQFEHVTFLVQLRHGEAPSANLAQEAAHFGDIFVLRLPADDAYECLTLKVLFFLRWYANSACSSVFHYVLKSDHDSYWHVASLLRLLRARQYYLASRHAANNFSLSNSTRPRPPSPLEILGSIQVNATVHRDPKSKFCTPNSTYSPSVYPLYASGGPGYVLSAGAAAAIAAVAAAPTAPPPLWLEDVHVTGILAASATASVKGGQLYHVHSEQIYYAPQPVLWTDAQLLDNPPLAVHGITQAQLRRLHRLLAGPAVANRTVAMHSFQ